MSTAGISEKLSIGQIRDRIQSVRWLRNDLVGGTTAEFQRANVGPQLTAKIDQLAALQIPPRFAADIARRDEEIEFCRRGIARWEQARKSGSVVH